MAKKAQRAKRAKRKAKHVYSFGGGKAEGRAAMKNLLGGKGANLAEMARLGVPVPAGFTITTDVCTHFMLSKGKYPAGCAQQVDAALAKVEKHMGTKFGDPDNPLLVSCRSGARQSMPGMMETVLNVGLTTKTIPGLIARVQRGKTGPEELAAAERFVWDSYRRLITMYSDVVMEKAADIEPPEDQGIRKQLEKELDKMKERVGAKQDTDLAAEHLKELCGIYKATVQEILGKPFPDTAGDQLWGSISAVFQSWNGKRAIAYRRIEGIPDEWGTATNVQAMVFGNMGNTSATGVAFTRDPATGDDKFYGEWLPNAQGEDVVAGIRTPNPLNEETRQEGNTLPSLELAMPGLYTQLHDIRDLLEHHYRDMQDLEFTIQEGTLWLLQTRTGKRNGLAALRMAMQDYKRGWLDREGVLMRVHPEQVDELLHPMLDIKAEKKTQPICKGLPAGPGGAVGRVVFTAEEAVAWELRNKQLPEDQREPCILVREETNPEDVEGMRAARGILTARGGMTSHAALVARAWGKCCIVGAGDLDIDLGAKTITVGGKTIAHTDWVSLNGSAGKLYEGKLPLVDSEIVQVLDGDLDRKTSKTFRQFQKFMRWADARRTLAVRANADTPKGAARALQLGAIGIGLFRTEHMFYGEGCDEPLFKLRAVILSNTDAARQAALDDLFEDVKKDIKATLEAMDKKPVTIRLLDPPLHEFVPSNPEERAKLAERLNITTEDIAKRAEELRETNPMMGHRGVRLGITYPEVSAMQIRAIFEAAAELRKAGKKPEPEIMIPVLCDVRELDNQKVLIARIHDQVAAACGLKKIKHLVGTMIEIPRAALLADEIARSTAFFSFGTNDLTQMAFGFSRDDVGSFVPDYISEGILPKDPFQVLDQKGVGQLVEMAIERGRAAAKADGRWLKIGICGEHGGEPASVIFCHRVGMDYVSCSAFRVPVARHAAAQAVILERRAATGKAAAKKAARKKKPSKTTKK